MNSPTTHTLSGAAGSLPSGMRLETVHIDTFGRPAQHVWHIKAWVPDPEGGEQLIGRLDYNEFEDRFTIEMIAVRPDFRRRGVALAMIAELTKKAPWSEISKSYATSEGAKLMEAVERDRGNLASRADEAATTGVLLPCKPHDIIDERTWCIYKHDPADHSKAAKVQPKGWPRHFASEEAGKRGLAAMHAHAGSPPIPDHRIFVVPVHAARTHQVTRPFAEPADETIPREWPAEGPQGVLLVALRSGELADFHRKLAALERTPPQISAVHAPSRKTQVRGAMQLAIQFDWQDNHPRGFWVPGPLIQRLIAEGWPDLRTLGEIPPERVPAVPQQITRRPPSGRWSEALPVSALTHARVHYDQQKQGARLDRISFALQLDPRRSGWTAMLLEGEIPPGHFRGAEGSSVDTTRGPSDYRHPLPRPQTVPFPDDPFVDCRVSPEDAETISHLAKPHPRTTHDLALLRQLSPDIQLLAVRAAIDLAVQFLPEDEHLSRFWHAVRGEWDAGRSPGAVAARENVNLPHAWPAGSNAPVHWALYRWASQAAQAIALWAQAVGADKFDEPLHSAYVIPEANERAALFDLQGAIEKLMVAVALADPVSNPDAPLHGPRDVSHEEYENQVRVWEAIHLRFLTCWWAFVQRHWPVKDAGSAEVSGPPTTPEPPPNPYPEGSDGHLLFSELVDLVRRYPEEGTEPRAIHRSLIRLYTDREGTEKHHTAWKEVVPLLVDAGFLRRVPVLPLTAASFDGRFSVPGCPQIVWDSRDGLGAVGNNADIRWFGFVVLMRPGTFLRLVAPLDEPRESLHALELYRQMPGLAPPMLYLDVEDPGLIRVIGHEGRHRATLTQQLCPDALLPVAILPQYLRARNVTEELLRNIRLGIRSERTQRRYDDSRFVVGPLFDRVFIQQREVNLSEPRAVSGPQPGHEDLARRRLMRLIADWNRGAITADEMDAAFALAERESSPQAVAQVLAELRPQGPKVVDALMRRLPPEVRIGRIEVTPGGSVEVETTQQVPEDDPVLPIVRAFDEATTGQEAMVVARDYLDSLWRTGLSPAKLRELIGRLEPMILGPDEWSGKQVAQFLSNSLARQLKKPYVPGDTVGGPPPEEVPPLTPKEQEIIAANEQTPHGRRFVQDMIRLLNKSPEEARRVLLRPRAWAQVLEAARNAEKARKKVQSHGQRLEGAVWRTEPPIEMPSRAPLENFERHAIHHITGEHALRTGRNRRAPHEVVSRVNDEASGAQIVTVRVMDDYYQLRIPFNPVDPLGRRFVWLASKVPDAHVMPPKGDAGDDARLVDPIIAFLESGQRNLWVRIGPLEVYVRRTTRIFGHTRHRTLDLANFKIDDEREIGKGHWARFMRAVTADPRLAGWTLYVENVIGGSPHSEWKLVDWFQKRSAEWVQSGTWPPSFWMLRPDSVGEDPPGARGV